MNWIPRVAVSAVAGARLAGMAPAVSAVPSSVTADRYSRPVVKVTCDAANVRSKPRKNSRLVGVVYRGEKVRILGGLKRKHGFSHWKTRFREGGETRTGWIIFDCADWYRQ